VVTGEEVIILVGILVRQSLDRKIKEEIMSYNEEQRLPDDELDHVIMVINMPSGHTLKLFEGDNLKIQLELIKENMQAENKLTKLRDKLDKVNPDTDFDKIQQFPLGTIIERNGHKYTYIKKVKNEI
jgi:16S rRNA U1498 N3-methylase RsmE